MKNKNINVNWELLDRHAPWSHIPSRTLAEILNISYQSLANWKHRGYIPEPEPQSRFGKNCNYYRVGKLLSLLLDEPEEVITQKWICDRMDFGSPFENQKQAEYVASVGFEIIGIEKPLL